MARELTLIHHLIHTRRTARRRQGRTPLAARRDDELVAGEYLTDRYEWAIPAGAAPGAYAIEVGMYDPVSGRRLPVTLDGTPQPGDRVLLDAALQVQ